jgi:hypothetical protein
MRLRIASNNLSRPAHRSPLGCADAREVGRPHPPRPDTLAILRAGRAGAVRLQHSAVPRRVSQKSSRHVIVASAANGPCRKPASIPPILKTPRQKRT